MSAETFVLILVVITALGFDFTNGFHDTGNAMATSIATGALKPRVAVAVSAVLNLVGAFLSISVALTVTNAVVKTFNSDATSASNALTVPGDHLLMIVMGGLIGGIVWNLLTWLVGLPSSSSHALFGGLIGAGIASLGWSGINWVGDGTKLDGVVGKVLLPALLSPVVAALVSGIGTWMIYKIVVGVAARFTVEGFRWGQIGTASLVSLAYGTNDAQKTMGVITLALIGSSHWSHTDSIPLWVKVACAVAIALGTYLGGWRIIRTLGKGLVEIESPQGMAAEAASAAVILASTHFGFALSTTHVATGSILGTGLGKPGAQVRWGVAGRMVVAWVLTLPAAAVVGGLMWGIGNLFGNVGGSIVEFVILLALSGYIFIRSQRNAVGAHNVNEEWEGADSEPSKEKLTTGGVR